MWIIYMCVCALSSVNDVPTWNQRALVKRNTYSESACWYAGQIAKLTVPLAYNFLTFLPRDIHQNSTFYNFLGRAINLTPLGTWFDYLFPICILLPVCATLFNLYGKIKNVLGFGILEDDEGEEENTSGFGTGFTINIFYTLHNPLSRRYHEQIDRESKYAAGHNMLTTRTFNMARKTPGRTG
jgi:hypothetical protein